MEQRKNSSSFIYSYLPFSDDRIQFLDIRGWDGQAIKLNREFYIDFLRNKNILYSNFSEEKIKDIKNEIVERTEDVDGIYILLGDDMESKYDGICYIGETSDFKRRMSQYFRGKRGDERIFNRSNEDFNYEKTKEFSSEIFFFSQRGKLGGAGLGESLRKAIEALVIQEATNSKRYHIVNRMSNYNGKLNLSDKDLLDEFYHRIMIILEHLGISLFKQKIEVKEDDNASLFICNERGTRAIMYKSDIGYVVLKGSKLFFEESEHLKRKYGLLIQKRSRLKEEGVLSPIEDGKFLELKEDQEFASSSSAATFVLGRSANGYTVWRSKEDPAITFGEFISNEISEEDD